MIWMLLDPNGHLRQRLRALVGQQLGCGLGDGDEHGSDRLRVAIGPIWAPTWDL